MKTAFNEVLSLRDREAPPADEMIIQGADPVVSTRFKIGETAAAVLGGIGVAVNDLWEMKTGERQLGSVDVRHAAAALRSTGYLQRPGADGAFKTIVNPNHELMMQVTQPYATKDGRYALPHLNLPHLQARVLKLLGADLNKASLTKAVAKWDALDLENAIDEVRACGGMVRTNKEWLETPHGQVLAAKPIVEIIKIGESAPEPLPAGDRPLSGIKALDLTRILAGPIAGRTLAEHGAEVLMVTAEHLPQVPEHVIDTSHGKRSCFLNLKDAEDAAQLKALVKDTDIFSQGYRPGMLEDLGFGPEQLAAIRPGIIYTSISCYGADGPFSHRAGWEQVAQTMVGIAAEGHPDHPKLLPAAANDYVTGYLAAYGMLLALARRAKEGGSYHVRVSLCQSGMFIYRQGQTAPVEEGMEFSDQELAAMRMDSHPAFGPIRHLSPVLKMSKTSPHWARPTPVLGGDKAEWSAAQAAVAAE